MNGRSPIDKVMDAAPTRLSELLAVAGPWTEGWDEDELGSILAYQLAVPFEAEVLHSFPRLAPRFTPRGPGAGARPETLGELLRQDQPPLERLELCKDFAKAASQQPSSAMPKDVALVLYYLSLASAQVRLARRITRLGSRDLCQGLLWAERQPWVPGDLRALLAKARGQVLV